MTGDDRPDEVSVRGPGLGTGPVVTGAVEATSASGVVVVGTTALVVLAVGAALGTTLPAVVALIAGGSLAVASWLCNRDGPLSTATGSLAVAIGVLAAAYALTRPFGSLAESFSVAAVLFVFAALVAGLGAGATIPGSIGSGQWVRTAVRAGATCVLPTVVVLAVLADRVEETAVLVDGMVSVLVEAVDVVVFPVGPGVNLGGFLALVSLTAIGVTTALGVMPLASFVAKDRRSAVTRRIKVTRRWLRRIAIVGVPLAVGLTVLPAATLQGFLVAVGVADVLRVVVDAHWLRGLLGAVAVLSGSAAALTVGVRRVARVDGRQLLRIVAATAPGGLLLIGVAAWSPGAVLDRFRVGPAAGVVTAAVDFLGASVLTMGVLVVLVLATVAVLSVVSTASGMGFVPDRTAAPSVAAGGILLVAVAAGIGIGPGQGALVTFTAVAASMVVWDVGHYGVDVTAELEGTTSRPVELLHAGGSVLVGGVLVGIALLALWASRRLAAGGGIDGPGLLALVALVLATILLMSTLDG